MDRDKLDAAWAELHDANAALGWFVGPPTQVRGVREMARCLREISAGRVPK
jgi:hypothetical protein